MEPADSFFDRSCPGVGVAFLRNRLTSKMVKGRESNVNITSPVAEEGKTQNN